MTRERDFDDGDRREERTSDRVAPGPRHARTTLTAHLRDLSYSGVVLRRVARQKDSRQRA